jgi:hypothetical protein
MIDKTTPGNVLKISKFDESHADELGLGEDGAEGAYGIVLDDDNMMVFCKIRQRGYPGAKGNSWTSRVYPIAWAEPEHTERVEDGPDDLPTEFWPIAAQAALNGGL